MKKRKTVTISRELSEKIASLRIGGSRVNTRSAILYGTVLLSELSPVLGRAIVDGGLSPNDSQIVRAALNSEDVGGDRATRVRASVPPCVHARLVEFRTLEGYKLEIQKVTDMAVRLWLKVVDGSFTRLEDEATKTAVKVIADSVFTKGDQNGCDDKEEDRLE